MEGLEWAALDRLHQQGMIGDPKNKNKSVALTDDAVADAAAAFQRLVGVEDMGRAVPDCIHENASCPDWGGMRKRLCRYRVNIRNVAYIP